MGFEAAAADRALRAASGDVAAAVAALATAPAAAQPPNARPRGSARPCGGLMRGTSAAVEEDLASDSEDAPVMPISRCGRKRAAPQAAAAAAELTLQHRFHMF